MSYDTQFTRYSYLFTFFVYHSLGISLNRATFSHFSPWIFDNFDHDLPPSRLFREHFTSPSYIIIIPLFSIA